MKTYTFHVSIPGTGRVWRKIELVEEHTLQDLHWAIQSAFDFYDDHLYSFFMSGKAWDASTEYSVPESALEFAVVDGEADEAGPQIDEATAQEFQTLLGIDTAPQSMEETLQMISSNAEVRGRMAKLMSERFGMPAFMADLALEHVGAMMGMELEGIPDDLFADDEIAGDARETTLESLGLQNGQAFMYLFDYGDEWRFRVKVHQIGEASVGVQYPRIVEAVGEAPQQYPDEEEDEDWAE